MRNRRRRRPHAMQEGFFLFLFVLLLFFSVLRVIDLLPSKEAAPAFAPSASDPAEASKESGSLPLHPVPISACEAGISVLSRGLDLRGRDPKILIYHTHTTEAYTATKESSYVQTSSYRTADPSKSVLAVGEALAERLRTQYGFSVIHDTTDHEPPNTASMLTSRSSAQTSCWKTNA